MNAWYLIFCKPRGEMVAQENLARQEYTTYLPKICTRRRRRGRYMTVIEPMFPRYLFIHLNDQTDDWGPIRSTYGITCMVRFGEQIARVPDRLVEILQAREGPEGFHRFPEPVYQRGDRVRIIEGVMSGYEGIFLAASGTERVIILLDIARRSTPVQLSAHHIELIS